MKLRVKVSCTSEEATSMIANLNNNYMTANIIKNGFIIDPKINDSGDFIIDPLLRKANHILLIDISENGGLSEDDNYAQVISGLSGKALRPYFIPRKNVIPCGEHAFFSIPESCVRIASHGEIITISKISIVDDKENEIAKLNFEILYSGTLDNLLLDNSENIRFKQAAEIAVDKSNCKNCTHVHYYVDTNTFSHLKKAA